MRKHIHKIWSLLAALTLIVANTGAGLASNNGWYQPKVPERLAK